MEDEYLVQVSVPLDSDGFMRRQCPNCEQQFKWHHGPANEEAEHHPSPPSYSCPLCGEPGAGDAWYTDEQLGLLQQAALGVVQDELEAAFRGVKGVRYEQKTDAGVDGSDPLVEPDDMVIVSSPCHGYEPVKVPTDHSGTLHCLVCGAEFTV